MRVTERAISPSELLDYYKFFHAHPQEFPEHAFAGYSEAVLRGFKQQWAMIYTRKFIKDQIPVTGDRRVLEQALRDECAEMREELQEFRLSDEQRQAISERIGHLSILHHLSVTADQAELCARAFIQK